MFSRLRRYFAGEPSHLTDEQKQAIQKLVAAKKRLSTALHDREVDAEIISFGFPWVPKKLLFIVAVRTEAERLALEGSGDLEGSMRHELIVHGYAAEQVSSMQIKFESEEKHRIFSWLER